MNKIVSVIISAGLLFTLSASYNKETYTPDAVSAATSSVRYTAEDLEYLQDHLLARHTDKDLTGKPYDLNDDGEYYAFCSRAYTDLYRIHQCYLNNNENNLSSAEKRKISLMIYNSDPWAEIKRKRYWAMCSKKEKIYLTMFRAKVLFRYYCLRDMIKKSSGR